MWWAGHDYQTHHARCPKFYLLYVGMYHPAEKMLCLHVQLSHFVVVTVTLVCSVPSTEISPGNLCFLIVQHKVHFAGWSDVSTTLCGFSEAQNLVLLFMNPLRWKWALSLNHSLSWSGTAA